MDARVNEELLFDAMPVYGSAAPALERPEPREREQEQAQEQARERVSIRTRTQAKSVNRQGISLFAVAGWMCTAVLVTALLMAHIELNAIADETYTLTSELKELQTQQDKLKIDYESTFKLDQVEEYAANILGMVPAESGQIVYLNDQAEDQAVILNREDGGAGLLARVKSRLTALWEYFK